MRVSSEALAKEDWSFGGFHPTAGATGSCPWGSTVAITAVFTWANGNNKTGMNGYPVSLNLSRALRSNDLIHSPGSPEAIRTKTEELNLRPAGDKINGQIRDRIALPASAGKVKLLYSSWNERRGTLLSRDML
jgi:hypothetical protein